MFRSPALYEQANVFREYDCCLLRMDVRLSNYFILINQALTTQILIVQKTIGLVGRIMKKPISVLEWV